AYCIISRLPNFVTLCWLFIFLFFLFFFFQAEDGIRDGHVTGVQTCALPISLTCWTFVAIAPGNRWSAGRSRKTRSSSSGSISARSEERRVGKECRSGWSPYH